MTGGTGREARTQGAPICRRIGATEDAASRPVTPVRRPGSLSGQALKASQRLAAEDGLVETFVVRVFVPADPGGVPFCGVVEHPVTGSTEAFQSTQDLIEIVLHELERDGAARAADTTDEEGDAP
jgi:hypothetical protein